MMRETHSTQHSCLSLDDVLNPGPEAPTGLLHHLPVYGDALLLDGGNERYLGGMRASVSLILHSVKLNTDDYLIFIAIQQYITLM